MARDWLASEGSVCDWGFSTRPYFPVGKHGLVPTGTAGFHTAEAVDLLKPRIGTCSVSPPPHSVHESRSQRQRRLKCGLSDSASFGEQLQSVVAILQSTTFPLDSSLSVPPAFYSG